MKQLVKQEGRWRMQSGNEHPYFSEAQYETDFLVEENSFGLSVIKKIAPEFDPLLIYYDGLALIKDSFEQRAVIVSEGYQFCHKNNCAPGSEHYETWSTPSRDKRLLMTLKELEGFIQNISFMTGEPLQMWDKMLKEGKFSIDGLEVSYQFLRTLWLTESYSSDPRDAPDVRWTLTGKAFFDQLATKLIPLHQQRLDKISESNCRPSNCEEGSSLYESAQTRSEDFELQKLFLNTVYYCKNTFQAACEDLLHRMESTIVGGESMKDYLLRSNFFQSSPLVANELRWGRGEDLNEYDVFFRATKILENSRGTQIFHSDSSGRVLYRDGRERELPKGFAPLHLFPGDHLLGLQEETGSYAFWVDGQTTNLNLKKSEEMLRLRKDLVALDDHILLEDGETLYLRGPWTGLFKAARADEIKDVLLLENGVLSLVDTESPEKRKIKIADNVELLEEWELIDGQGFWRVLTRRSFMSSEIELYVVNMETGEVQPKNFVGSRFVTRLAPLKWLMERDKVYQVQFKSDFSILEKKWFADSIYSISSKDKPVALVATKNKSFFVVSHQGLDQWDWHKLAFQLDSSSYLNHVSQNYLVTMRFSEFDSTSQLIDFRRDQVIDQASVIAITPIKAEEGYLIVGNANSDPYLSWEGKGGWKKIKGELARSFTIRSVFEPVNGAQTENMISIFSGDNFYSLTHDSTLISLPGQVGLFHSAW